MTRFFSFLMLTIIVVTGATPAVAQYSDCKPLYYFDKAAPQYTYTAFVPSQMFAVKMTPIRAGRLDSVIIAFGITKTPTTKTISDTVIIKIYEDQLPTRVEIGSYVFPVPPDITGLIPDMNWVMELRTDFRYGTEITPQRDVWVAWKFSGPSADRARVKVRKASPASGRSVVINANGTTTPMTSVAWSQLGDTVDLDMEGRICYTPDPVELSSFLASYVEGKTYLEWITAGETDNFGFEVQRLDGRSDDGMISMWQQMGFVPGNGTTTVEHRYSFIDENPRPAMGQDGMVRYRLKQIDYDGTTDVSPVQSVLISGSAMSMELLPVYPNPVSLDHGTISVPFSVAEDQSVLIEVRDILGKVVAVAFNGEVRRGSHSIAFPATALTPGWYTCSLTSNGASVSKRFMVVR